MFIIRVYDILFFTPKLIHSDSVMFNPWKRSKRKLSYLLIYFHTHLETDFILPRATFSSHAPKLFPSQAKKFFYLYRRFPSDTSGMEHRPGCIVPSLWKTLTDLRISCLATSTSFKRDFFRTDKSCIFLTISTWYVIISNLKIFKLS